MWATIALLALAQSPCTDVQAEETAGKWIAGGKLDGRNEKIWAALKNALPEPRGFDVKVSKTARGVSAYFLAYYCVPNKGFAENIRGTVRRGDETGTAIHFSFDSIDWLANERMRAGELQTASGEPILYLAKQKGELRGVPLYAPDIHRGRRGEEAIVLGPASPYRELTHAELARAKIEQKKRTFESREREHQKLMATREKRIAEMKTDADREKISQRFDNWQKQFAAAQAAHESELATLENDVGQGPASEDGRPLGVAVRGTPMLAIYWTWDKDSRVKEAALQALKAGLDLDALKQLTRR